jgi:hypothetical protein
MSENGELAPDGTGSEPLKTVGISWPDANSLKAERPPLQAAAESKRHPYRDRGNDLYETPPAAVTALIKAESALQQPCKIWDPCCGRQGNITNVLRAGGHSVIASDLCEFGVPFTAPAYFKVDFLLEYKLPDGFDKVVMNPPFMLIEQFIAHALDLSCSYVAALTRLCFYEAGTGKHRKHRIRRRILDGEIPPARIHVFRGRLPMMHRDGWAGRKTTSRMAFCWMIWDRSHVGPTTISRISWERTQ